MAKVYMTKDISPAGLMKAYRALGRQATGRVGVKISSGEPGGHNFLSPSLIKPLVDTVHGTIIECNTAYEGKRIRTADHRQTMHDHGFAAIAPFDIMDADGEISIPIKGGRHLTEDVVGKNLEKYSFIVNLAHFKGHPMAGMGGVLKNMSIGIASSKGKSLIHSAGKETTGFSPETPQKDFLESMAEAAKGVADWYGDRILYIDVMNRLSVDCDCLSDPAEPTMKDIGILSSLDPVSLDRACYDLVHKAPDGHDLVQRMKDRQADIILTHAEEIGLGSNSYELISLD